MKLMDTGFKIFLEQHYDIEDKVNEFMHGPTMENNEFVDFKYVEDGELATVILIYKFCEDQDNDV